MKEALLHINDALNWLRRYAGPPTIISVLEDAQASLMHDIFGTPLRPRQPHLLDDRPNSDWTLGPDEPMPHHGEARLPVSDIGDLSRGEQAH